MHKHIFVNLPVADLPRSKTFFAALGLTFEPRFTDHTAACMILGENIFAMLLTHEKFRGFTPKPISDAHTSTEVLTCLSCESRAEVEDLVAKALAAGGTAPQPPMDYGFMYAHGFTDLDGHIWELMFMDMSAAPPEMQPPQPAGTPSGSPDHQATT
ncbi:VOC family protein [Pigmentiphaga litoralis]|uniref:Glyoxalase/Bleomycin resistance-like N-terminal domain-containing protein n=1 Tax=Pigmentiphaga litoralis TaxID=516702 RepID=A0A7Y9LPK2_9BURK|nr:VOC family protein [Pigmentiphaga litoralis]NYE22234.1 hypothetical protein [Pigmentiphaga litoralis]NYE84151.1 hypothetical protein [Pigmentiphaga litoralis]